MGESSRSIEDLCAHLDLGPHDSVGLDLNDFLDEEVPNQGPKWCIVGRFVTKRNINFKAIQEIMLSVWSPVMKMWMKELESNLFLIQFEHEMDHNKVVNGGPWTFDQHLFVFKPIQEDSNPHAYPDKNAPRLFGMFLRAPVGRNQFKPNSQWNISKSYGGWSEASSRTASEPVVGGIHGDKGTEVNLKKANNFKRDSIINDSGKSGNFSTNQANLKDSSVAYFSHNNPLFNGDSNSYLMGIVIQMVGITMVLGAKM
ncbi:hypothetical protein LguiA_001977 [Lonicera macranthoides]